MKSKLFFVVAVAFAGLNLVSNNAAAQGSLTPPPGAPAPVMKSLDQVEARIPLVAGSPGVTVVNGRYQITNSGSYYLTGNIVCTNGAGPCIGLSANNITLDLNGFTLFGTNGNLGDAIHGGGYGYRVFNGHIVGGTTQTNGVFTQNGFDSGITLFTGSVNLGSDSLVSDVTVRGMSFRGIQASLNSVVKNCSVDTTVDYGISAGTVTDCNVINTGGDAISAGRVSNCLGKSVGSGHGISYYVSQQCSVQNSTGEANTGVGIFAHSVVNSYGKSTTGTGIAATIVTSSVGHRESGRAISATIGNGCLAAAGTNQITHKYNMP